MNEEKNGGSNAETIDPAFLAQVTRKCALYRTAANTEKQKKQDAVDNITNVLGGRYDVVENAKREHNDEAFPNSGGIDTPLDAPTSKISMTDTN